MQEPLKYIFFIVWWVAPILSLLLFEVDLCGLNHFAAVCRGDGCRSSTFEKILFPFKRVWTLTRIMKSTKNWISLFFALETENCSMQNYLKNLQGFAQTFLITLRHNSLSTLRDRTNWEEYEKHASECIASFASACPLPWCRIFWLIWSTICINQQWLYIITIINILRNYRIALGSVEFDFKYHISHAQIKLVL